MNISKINHPEFDVIVMATDFHSPLELQFRKRLSEEVKKLMGANPGTILFDLICSNGPEWNRFFSMFYNGNEIDPCQCEILPEESLDQEILSIQVKKLKENPEWLARSILCDFQKEEILN